jgi:hypothetical protein
LLGCTRIVSAGWAISVALMKEAPMAVEWTIRKHFAIGDILAL